MKYMKTIEGNTWPMTDRTRILEGAELYNWEHYRCGKKHLIPADLSYCAFYFLMNYFNM